MGVGRAVVAAAGVGTKRAGMPSTAWPAGNVRAPRARAFLTFDDGPSNEILPDGSKQPVVTAAILDRLASLRRELAAPELSVTFCWVGRYIERHPGIVRRALDEGHCIANHSWSHPHLDTLADADVRIEIERPNAMIAQVTGGYRARLFRAPYGEANARTARIIREAGMQTLGWTVDTGDWIARSAGDDEAQAVTIADTFRAGLARVEESGGEIVVLCHDGARGARSTVLALDTIVPALHERGYRLLGADHLANERTHPG